ncbi:hypothetical protein PGT21_014394 [Puccinia graminis f. sp. tritici]|uniref:RING-type domain-containing protein n=1 Tax=Puccinia graminis f. sp. tritici TaxID=56615 RepID=A0A5B0MR40_PUCGR|nr:hypothetical protein PGT21_014394 [Puccinia graminis f. sp. tritici]
MNDFNEVDHEMEVATSHQLASELSNQNLEEVADQNSGVVQWHQSSEIEPVQEAQNIKKFPCREVDWEKFTWIKFSPNLGKFITVDKNELSRDFNQKENMKNTRKNAMEKIKNLINYSQPAMERRKEFQSKEVQLKSGVTLNSQENCVICLREYQEIEDPESLLVIFPGCEHVFHYTCLKDWFNGRRVIKSLFIHGNSCPICRKLAPTKNYSKFLGSLYLSNFKVVNIYISIGIFSLLWTYAWSVYWKYSMQHNPNLP